MTLLITLLLACGHGTPAEAPPEPAVAKAQPVAELPSRPEAEEVAAVEVPEAYRTVRSLLLSRDGFIKPGRDVLDAHPEATEALEWLAGHDEMLLVRERALLTLDQYPDEATARVCVDFLSAEHAKVRAAAVRCLQGQDLAASQELRTAVEAMLRDEDIRPGVAALEVLLPVEPSRPVLEAATEDPQVHETTRARIVELLP